MERGGFVAEAFLGPPRKQNLAGGETREGGRGTLALYHGVLFDKHTALPGCPVVFDVVFGGGGGWVGGVFGRGGG